MNTFLDMVRTGWNHRILFISNALLLRFISMIVLWPLFGGMMRWLVMTSGQDALTDDEIARFILSPVGLAGTIFCAVLGLAILAMEQSSLQIQSFGIAHGFRISMTTALLAAARRIASTVWLCLLVLLRSLWLLAPGIAAAVLIVWLLLGDVDINYYLAEKPPKFWLAAALVSIVLVPISAILVLRLAAWSLSLPILLVTRSSPRDALVSSQEVVGNSRARVAGIWVIWFLANALASSLFTSLIIWLTRFTSDMAGGRIAILVPFLGGFLLVWLAGALLLSLVQGITFAILVASLYRRLGWEQSHGAEVRSRLGENWLNQFYQNELMAEPVTMASSANQPEANSTKERLDRRSRMWLWWSAGLSMLAVVAGIWMLVGQKSTEDAVVLAHRGAAGLRPENTLSAFELACVDRTDYVELDVQETADGEVIVFHDSDYMKVAGVNVKVWDATLAQLRDIDIGSHFAKEYHDQRTPLLRDALRLCKGRAKVDIELKYYGHNQRLVERVIEIVEQEGMREEVILMSLHHPFVVEAKRLRPTWTVGLLAAVGVGDLTSLESDFLAVNTRTAKPGLIRRAHQRGKQVYVWTLDNPMLMSYFLGLGADGLITNRPDLAREVIEQLRDMSPTERLLLDASIRFGVVPAESKSDESDKGA